MHHKNLLRVTISMFLAITIAVFSCKNNKPADKIVYTTDSTKKQTINDTFRIRQLTNVKFEATAQRLKQGEYLANSILMCFTCHSPRDWNAPGSPPIENKKGSGGTVVYKDSSSLVIAPNITPDKETGAGNWTDDMIARAVREGVGHDGRALSWQMPYNVFRNLSDEDLASVIVYLRTLPAIHNVVAQTKISAGERSGTEKNLSPLTEPIATPDQSTPFKRGMYLVKIGECLGCHTAHSEYNPGLFGGGNFVQRFEHAAFSANLTIDPSGIIYGSAGLITVLRTGKGATLSPAMPWIAFEKLNDEDIKSIYAYLSTVQPSQHHVNTQQPFTLCAICGEKHGLGDKNKRTIPTGIKLDPALFDQYVGNYFSKERNSTYFIFKEGDKLYGKQWDGGFKSELIPQTELRFLAAGWPIPVHFVKDKDGKVNALAEETDYGSVFTKIK